MSIAADSAPFSYDEVAYPAAVVAALTPDRIRAAGFQFGWNAPDASTASVLEIGCGDGFNLIGMATVAPQARFVGFDLSSQAIERGRGLVREAGLTNVDLHEGNILDYARDGTKFDYVVSHGVYGWIPPNVRTSLLDLMAARLAPGGVAYVSYDCLPAAATKQALTRLVLDALKDVRDPQERVRQSLTLYGAMIRHQRSDSRLKPQLDQLKDDLPGFDLNYFYHDYLAEYYAPSSLANIAAAAGAVGLMVAGDAGMTDLYLGDLDEEARGLVEGADWAERGTLLDMFRGSHMFRRTFFVHADAPPPAVTPDCLAELRYSFLGEKTVNDDGSVRYQTGPDVFITTTGPLDVDVLGALHAAYPGELTCADIVAQTGREAAAVAAFLKRITFSTMLSLHSTPQPHVAQPGPRPKAADLVRIMVTRGTFCVTLRHARYETKQDPTRAFLALCDGTRTREDIAAEMSRIFTTDIDGARIEGALAEMSRNRLFVA